jgi:adenylate cyclase
VHHGRVVKRTGDGIIIEFRSVVDAVRCAIEVQNGMVERNAGLPPERRMEFRVGSHLGDVVEESDGDLMGDGVNIAARLEGVAEPGGICLSEDAYRHVRDKVKEEFVDLGDKELKNIARPIRVYAVNMALGGLLSVQRAWTHERSKPQRLSILVLPFSMQDEIVARLANSFNAQLAAAEARRAERASNPDAMDLYFRGGHASTRE